MTAISAASSYPQTDARLGIALDGFTGPIKTRFAHLLAQKIKRLGNAVAPVAENARGGGAGAKIAGAEDFFEQRLVDRVMRLMEPQGFELVRDHEPGLMRLKVGDLSADVGFGLSVEGTGAVVAHRQRLPPHELPFVVEELVARLERRSAPVPAKGPARNIEYSKSVSQLELSARRRNPVESHNNR